MEGRGPFKEASSRSGRITRDFHEKAGPCQAVFLVVPFVQPTADQREAQLAFSLSFLERFFVRPSIQPIADQREAHNAAIPNSQITDSPYFHPHSWWSDCSGASWVSSMGNGCCRLGAELSITVSSDVVPGPCRSHPNSAICFQFIKLLLSSPPGVSDDFAVVRTPQR